MVDNCPVFSIIGSMMIDKENKLKTAIPSAGEILKGFKAKTEQGEKTTSWSSTDLSKKISKLEKIAEYQMAIETFLDCEYDKVKKSNRVYGLPKKYRV
jgi:Sec-independent protein translocase protein TatA